MKPLTTSDLKAESLVLRIMQWSEMEESQRIVDAVKMFAFQIVTNIQVKVGDVVMCRMPTKNRSGSTAAILNAQAGASSDIRSDVSDDDDIVGDSDDDNTAAAHSSDGANKVQEVWQYCRVYRVLDTCVIVHNSPLEAKTFSVSNDNVIPFDAEMRSQLGYAKSMQKLVQDPVDILYGRIQKRVKKALGTFLSEAGVDYYLLKKTFSNQVALYEQPQLEATLKLLEQLVENESQEFYKKMEQLTSPEIQSFISGLDLMTLFTPTRESSLAQLRNLPITAFARNRLKYLILTAQTNLDMLNLERRNLLMGKEKTVLSEWYLNHIENSVDKWLESNGYDFGAVPLDYIEKPPRGNNLYTVRDNLELIEKCMASEDTLNVGEFMTKLKDEVYTRIDKFCSSMMIVVGDVLDEVLIPESLGEVQKNFDEGLYTDQIEEASDSGKLPVEMWIRDALADIEYILEMKKLEEVTFNKKKVSLSKVVPITGLIFSRFHRLENELRTVLELWSHLDRQNTDYNGDDGGRRGSLGGLHGNHHALVANRRLSAKFKKNDSDTPLPVGTPPSNTTASKSTRNQQSKSSENNNTSSNKTKSSENNNTSSSSSSSSSKTKSAGSSNDQPLSPRDNSEDANKINEAISSWAGVDLEGGGSAHPTKSHKGTKAKMRRLSRMVRPSSLTGSKVVKHPPSRPARSDTYNGPMTSLRQTSPASLVNKRAQPPHSRTTSTPPLPSQPPPGLPPKGSRALPKPPPPTLPPPSEPPLVDGVLKKGSSTPSMSSTTDDNVLVCDGTNGGSGSLTIKVGATPPPKPKLPRQKPPSTPPQ